MYDICYLKIIEDIWLEEKKLDQAVKKSKGLKGVVS